MGDINFYYRFLRGKILKYKQVLADPIAQRVDLILGAKHAAKTRFFALVSSAAKIAVSGVAEASAEGRPGAGFPCRFNQAGVDGHQPLAEKEADHGPVGASLKSCLAARSLDADRADPAGHLKIFLDINS
jgi:hypothetical protein